MRFWKSMFTHRGFYYHFAKYETGERIWDSEVSSIDTAMLSVEFLLAANISGIWKSIGWLPKL